MLDGDPLPEPCCGRSACGPTLCKGGTLKIGSDPLTMPLRVGEVGERLPLLYAELDAMFSSLPLCGSWWRML